MLHYCVIGYPVSHSLSPKLHNRWFRSAKIQARYLACKVQSKKLPQFMKNFRERFEGASVTIPHKEKIIRFLDKLSPEARSIGAVNTIVKMKGQLIGYNTDVYGAMEALQRSRIKDQNAVVLGAGGAARAIVYGLKKAGAQVCVLNRSLSHAKKLAQDFQCEYGRLEEFDPSMCDILINATSVGMLKTGNSSRNDSPIPFLKEKLKNLKKKPIVMDIVYRPRMTRFLRDAKKADCKIITGDKMFVAQAARSFELWSRHFPKNSDPVTSGGGASSSGSSSP